MTRFTGFTGGSAAGRRGGVFGALLIVWSFTTGGSGAGTLLAADDSIDVGRAVAALAATCVTASTFERNTPGMGLYDDGPYLVGTQLSGGEARTGTFLFHRGVEYLLIGWGDNEAQDVDIKIMDEQLRVVEMDVAHDANPVVRFRPTRTGNYTVELKLFAPGKRGDSSFCCMMLLEEGGWTVPLENCQDAIINLAKVANYVLRNEDGAVTISSGDCWSVSGIVLRPEEQHINTNFRLRNGRHILIGAGDSHTKDLDNRVESINGRLLGEDRAADPFPITAFHSNGGLLKTTTSLPRCTGASLVLQAILQVD